MALAITNKGNPSGALMPCIEAMNTRTLNARVKNDKIPKAIRPHLIGKHPQQVCPASWSVVTMMIGWAITGG